MADIGRTVAFLVWSGNFACLGRIAAQTFYIFLGCIVHLSRITRCIYIYTYRTHKKDEMHLEGCRRCSMQRQQNAERGMRGHSC